MYIGNRVTTAPTNNELYKNKVRTINAVKISTGLTNQDFYVLCCMIVTKTPLWPACYLRDGIFNICTLTTG